MVPAGTQALAINPLNWKTDSTPADKSLNQGACFTNYDGEIETEVPQFTGAYLDPDRGTLRVTDVDPAAYSNSLFPDGVYHLYDYQSSIGTCRKMWQCGRRPIWRPSERLGLFSRLHTEDALGKHTLPGAFLVLPVFS